MPYRAPVHRAQLDLRRRRRLRRQLGRDQLRYVGQQYDPSCAEVVAPKCSGRGLILSAKLAGPSPPSNTRQSALIIIRRRRRPCHPFRMNWEASRGVDGWKKRSFQGPKRLCSALYRAPYHPTTTSIDPPPPPNLYGSCRDWWAESSPPSLLSRKWSNGGRVFDPCRCCASR